MTSTEYKALRERLDLTQGELAALLGVTRKTINARENGAKITQEAALAMEMLWTCGKAALLKELSAGKAQTEKP